MRVPTDFKAVKVDNISAALPVLPDEMLTEYVEMLSVSDEQKRAALFHDFRRMACQYQIGEAIAAKYLMPSEAKKAVADVGAALGGALDKLNALGPMVLMRLDAILVDQAENEHGLKSMVAATAALSRIRDVAAHYVETHDPAGGRPRNANLEMTLGALMLSIKLHAGQKVTVSLKKGRAYNPRLTSPGAEVIGRLLTSIDPRLTIAAIANKIADIRSAGPDSTLSRYSFVLMPGRVTHWIRADGIKIPVGEE